MTTCVVFNEKGEYVNLIVAEPTDWKPEGWTYEVVPEGYYWDGVGIVPIKPKDPRVTPEII
jgi:hypothetical protein